MEEETETYHERPKLSDYKERLKVSWDKGLQSVLNEKYPGSRNAVEAMRSLLKPKQVEDPVSKLKQVQAVIELRSKGLDLNKIPESRTQELAQMPIDTVEEIRAWGIQWLEEIKRIK